MDFLCRVGGAATKVGNIEQLPEISMNETVLDVAVPNPTDDQMTDVPDHLNVDSEDDLVGKKACIAYLDNLKMLTSFLQFPMKACTFCDPITGVKCPGRPPFQVEMKPRGTAVVLEWVSKDYLLSLCACAYVCTTLNRCVLEEE